MTMFSHLWLLSFDSPINFLRGSESDRFAIAATFGATASTCLELALSSDLNHIKFIPEDSHPWVKGINKLQLIKSIIAFLSMSSLATFGLQTASLLRVMRSTNCYVSPYKTRCSAVIFISQLQQNIMHINYSSVFLSVSRLTVPFIFRTSNDNCYS